MMTVFLAFLYVAGSVVCHQIPERSFHLFGVQLPVCARCTGLYLSGLSGLAAWTLWRFRLGPTVRLARLAVARAMAIAATPTALTLGTAAIGVWDPGNLGRAAAALPLGAAAGVVLGAVASKNLR